MRFVIYHQAPGGPKVYHVSTNCTVSMKCKNAKVYGRDETAQEGVEEQIQIVRRNFGFVFSNAGTENHTAHADYKNAEHWMGYGLEGIETKAEIL